MGEKLKKCRCSRFPVFAPWLAHELTSPLDVFCSLGVQKSFHTADPPSHTPPTPNNTPHQRQSVSEHDDDDDDARRHSCHASYCLSEHVRVGFLLGKQIT